MTYGKSFTSDSIEVRVRKGLHGNAYNSMLCEVVASGNLSLLFVVLKKKHCCEVEFIFLLQRMAELKQVKILEKENGNFVNFQHHGNLLT